ncbi:sulfatase-like hydrolase/transferase, partial [Planctomycetota bacterium]
PNILFLLADDQRFDTIAALGNEEVKTPNMDMLVERGLAFTNAHIPGGSCGAVCMPSRAMIHSGKNLYNLHNHGESIPSEHALLGETLQESGYECCGIGKWHNGVESYGRSFTDGGEIFFGGMWDHWNVPASHYDPTGKYATRVPYISDAFHSNKVDTLITDHITQGTHSSTLFANCAVNWLNNYEKDNPFFLYTAFLAPHDPRSMPEEFQNLYDPASIKLPDNFESEYPFPYGLRNMRDEMLAVYPRTEEETRQHIADYYGIITHLDYEIGRIIDALKAKGKFENTIIIFAGDNGLGLGQHGLMGKQSVYEHSVRVPLVISGPGVEQGLNTNSCYLLDLYPTICDMLEIETPAGVEGHSLIGELRGEEVAQARDVLYFSYGDLARGVKKKNIKLSELVGDKGRHTQLFDLETDPGEMNNHANNPEYAEVLVEMQDELLKQRELMNDIDTPVSKGYWQRY